MSKIWITGYMPMQLLLIFGLFLVIALAAGSMYRRSTGRPLHMLIQGVGAWLISYIILRFILYPPIPMSVLSTYMGLITIVIMLYVSSTEAGWQEAKKPVIDTLKGETPVYRGVRAVTFVALPLLVGYGTFSQVVPKIDEPIELRTVHPAPPQNTTVHGTMFTLQTAENPYRVDDEGKYLPVGTEDKYFNQNAFAPDAPKFLQYVREGGQVFFNTAGCFMCHGDNLDGRGPIAFAFNPIPANFADPGTIAQLQETFVFWRVAKGGPGLPREGFPWASAMPPWEQHLTTDEIWKVVMFEYWHTNFFPRTWD
jgi:hypothetical protein